MFLASLTSLDIVLLVIVILIVVGIIAMLVYKKHKGEKVTSDCSCAKGSDLVRKYHKKYHKKK